MRFRFGLLVACIIILSMISPVQGYAQAGGPVYSVQSGDTLYSIAIRFGTTVEEILLLNPGVDPASLAIGTQLVIPGFDDVSGVLITSSVRAGQTLDLLEKTHAASTEGIVKLNRILNPERLYIGQDLVLTENPENASLKPFIFQSADSLLATSASKSQNPWLTVSQLGITSLWAVGGTIGHAPSDEAAVFPDPVEFIFVTPDAPYQGRTLEVHVEVNADVIATGSLGEIDLRFVESEPAYFIALQGVDVLSNPGLTDLSVQLYSAEDNAPLYGFQQPIRIRNAGYPRDPVLRVPPESVDPANLQQEADAVAAAVSGITPDRGWNGTLLFPTAYYESFPSYFGSLRNYNDIGYNSYHSGLDLFGNADTPVNAPADGTVVMVNTLPARGLVVYLDHGWGVFTGYGHLSQVFVSEGERVAAGQNIAMVGSTGRVTGPHLHWEVLVGGTPVDPLEWVERNFPAVPQ